MMATRITSMMSINSTRPVTDMMAFAFLLLFTCYDIRKILIKEIFLRLY